MSVAAGKPHASFIVGKRSRNENAHTMNWQASKPCKENQRDIIDDAGARRKEARERKLHPFHNRMQLKISVSFILILSIMLPIQILMQLLYAPV